MNEIKFGLQISNIMIYLTSSTWGVTWAPPTPETPEIDNLIQSEIFNVALEYASLIQIHSLI